MTTDIITPDIQGTFRSGTLSFQWCSGIKYVSDARNISHKLSIGVRARDIMLRRDIRGSNKHSGTINSLFQIYLSPSETIINPRGTEVGSRGFQHRADLLCCHVRETLHQHGSSAGDMGGCHGGAGLFPVIRLLCQLSPVQCCFCDGATGPGNKIACGTVNVSARS